MISMGRSKEKTPSGFGGDALLGRVRLLVNAVLVLEALALPTFTTGALLGMAFYAGRRVGAGDPLYAACGAAAVLALVVCSWVRLKGRLFRRRDAAAFLDDHLGLNAALSAREEWGIRCDGGRGSRGLSLRLSARRIGWWAGGACLAVAGVMLPLPRQEIATAMPEPPPPLAEVARAIEEMELMQTVEESGLETFREQLESLQRETATDMYSHAGLEAADALEQRTASALMGLESQLQRAATSLAPLARGQGATVADLASLQNALAEMDSLELRPGGDLGRELQQLRSDAGVRELDPAAARQLRERLVENADRLRRLGGRCGWCSVVVPDDSVEAEMCRGGGSESGEDGQGAPGAGGIGRGRGDAPLAFRVDERERLDTRSHRLEGGDWSRAALGDSVGVEAGSPPPAAAAGGLEAGGTAAQPSEGGSAVWQDQLTPAEQDALKGIFR